MDPEVTQVVKFIIQKVVTKERTKKRWQKVKNDPKLKEKAYRGTYEIYQRKMLDPEYAQKERLCQKLRQRKIKENDQEKYKEIRENQRVNDRLRLLSSISPFAPKQVRSKLNDF